MQKTKAALLVGMGLMAAASYLNAAHTTRIAQHKPTVEISTKVMPGSMEMVSSDDWDSPESTLR